MKKFLVSLLLLIIGGFPLLVTAEEKEESKDFEITDDGIIIYGEDISELSEEELQYIPKDWREGNFNPEHDHEGEEEELITPFSNYPDVNSYIENISPVETSYQHKDMFTKFPYRNGVGEVEGVVAHETANDNSTIWGEISYMEQNHTSAFVHAFVDHNNVVEIHSPDYGAWGAGRFANERFVHVELVRVNNFDQFANSINNYAEYIANILYDYNLGVSSAESSGKGTLWSHKAVTNHLGGTNHVDPHGYFARYGYNWNEFTSLVTDKYNSIAVSKKANTSKLGQLNSNNVTKYDNPVSQSGASSISGEDANKVFYIKAEAVIDNKQYYLISNQASSSNGVVGWIEAKDIKVHNHNGIDNESKTLVVNGKGNAYSKAWGGSTDLVYNLSSYAGEEFKVNKTEKVGSNIWYRGILDGKQVFIHEAYVDEITESSTSQLGHLRGTAKIYERIGDENSAQPVNENQLNRVYYIKKQADFGNERYYLISEQASATSGTIGWIKSGDINTHKHTGIDSQEKTLIVSGQGSAYSKAWGGSEDLVYGLDDYAGEEFKVNKTEKVGSNIWYRGILDGKQVFIHEAYVDEITESSTSQLGHLRGTAKIYERIGDENSAQPVNENQLNRVYYIKKQADFGNERYYLISEQASATSGTIGWIKSGDINTHKHTGIDSQEKTLIVSGQGSAYSKAWGGSEDLVYGLDDYAGEEFKVNKTEKVGSNIWYRGILDGKQVFIHEAYVDEITESSTSQLGHLRGTAKIYERIGDENSAQPVNENQLNRVYYIKKQADFGNERYYLISEQASATSGTIGWIKSGDINTHKHTGIDSQEKTLIVSGQGSAYSKAWGGSEDLVYGLGDYAGEEFKVNKTEKVGSNIWYRGTLDGRQVFIHEAHVK